MQLIRFLKKLLKYIRNRSMEIQDWQEYLSNKSSFPFLVERIDDTDKVNFGKTNSDKYFRLGHTMEVLKIESEDDLYGIIVKAKEGRHTAFVPILDLEATDSNTINEKYLDEYAEWFATGASYYEIGK